MSPYPNSFELSEWIARPAAEIYKHLADPTNILGLQPLLVEMTPVSRGTVHGRPLLSYETVEAFRLGGLTVAHNRIAVRTLLTQEPCRIDTFVTGAAGLVMLATYQFADREGATLLTERVAVHIHPVLLPGVLATAKRVQRTTLARLKARLEARLEAQ
ncbi:MAG TPA: SRPBCC family protein [Chloroflexaceae bacterium]|nr:SRPBCC family protein [Chloroflexaceae bacterium]